MPKILVVDDEQQVAGALQRLLRREGFHVETALSGEEALDKLSSFAADLIISDFRMKGMDGAELLRRALSLVPRAVRVLLSGYVDERTLERTPLPAEAVSLFLRKPWDDDELVGQVRQLLGAAEATHA